MVPLGNLKNRIGGWSQYASKNRNRQVRRDVWICHGDSNFLVGQQIAFVGNDPRRVQLVLRDLLRGGSHGLASVLKAFMLQNIRADRPGNPWRTVVA